MQRVLVVGGSAGTGRCLVDLLEGWPVRVTTRRPEAVRASLPTSVDVVAHDLADPEASAAPLVDGVDAIVFTAGVAAGIRSEQTLRATELGGLNRLADAAEAAGFGGRFVYMTTLGLHHPNWFLGVLDLVKWNEVAIRKEAEDCLRDRRFSTTIVRAGVLTNDRRDAPPTLVPGDLPLTLGTRVGRQQVAQVLAAVLEGPLLDEVGVVGQAASEGVHAQLERLAAGA